MTHRPRNLALTWLAAAGPLVLAGGCSTSSSNDGGRPDGGAIDGGGDGGGTDGGGTDGGLPDGSCMPPGYGGGESSLKIAFVNVEIVDPQGAGVGNLPLFVTGLDIASAPSFTVDGGAGDVAPNLTFKAPAFRFGDALSYPRLAVPLTTSNTTLPSLVTAQLPATGAALTPGSAATSGDLTLNLTPATVVLIDTLTYDTADRQRLRATTLPVAKEADVIGSFGFGMLIGIAPAGTLFCPPVSVTVPNSSGWPAGAAVEFFVSGDDVGQQWAKWASWSKVSGGQVSSDGATISTAPAEGLPVLYNIGIRKAP